MSSGADSLKTIFYALGANLAIFVAKAVAAVATGSGAMFAEAVHSLADCANQVLLLVGLKSAKREASDDHPLGQGKAVYFWSFLVALLLFLMRPRLADWYLPMLFAATAAGLTARELRVAEPFIDVRMLGGNLPLLATFARQVLIYTASYVMMYGYAQWLEDGRGLSASVTGLVLLPTFLVAIGVSALTGRSPEIRGKLLVGGAVMVAATPLFLLVHAGSPIWLLLAISASAGLPQGLNGLANQNALYRQADPARMGSAAGLLRTFMYLGAIIASARGRVASIDINPVLVGSAGEGVVILDALIERAEKGRGG